MRMAKIYHTRGYLLVPPDKIVIAKSSSTNDEEFSFWIVGQAECAECGGAWTLGQTLDEAVAELNAAMNYDENLELEYLRKKLFDSEK